MCRLRSSSTIPPPGVFMSTADTLGTALITGASTGIGATYADRLARRGYDLILVARNKSNLEKLAARLSTEHGASVKVLPADLTVDADLHGIERVLREDASITFLVNNAGAATLGPLANADIERLDREIRLNVLAPTRLSHAALPGFIARNRGVLVNIASVMSQMVQPGNAVYGTGTRIGSQCRSRPNGAAGRHAYRSVGWIGSRIKESAHRDRDGGGRNGGCRPGGLRSGRAYHPSVAAGCRRLAAPDQGSRGLAAQSVAPALRAAL